MNFCSSNTRIGRKKRLLIMFLLTGGFMVTELIVGYCGDSLALVTDSFHMMSDMTALAIALVSITLSPKPWKRSTFGWARAEVLGALINCVFLMALCFSIMVEAVKRFFHPEPITEPRWIFTVGVCGLLINLIGLTMFKDHAHSHGLSGHQHSHGEKLHTSSPAKDSFSGVVIEEKSKDKELNGSQMNMHGVFLHVLADTMASVAVIISAGVVWATEDLRNEDYPCWKYIDFIDPALSILICFLIFVSTWPLLHQASMILLQTLPPNIHASEDIKKELEEIEGVIDVHDLHVWQLTGTKNFASVHLKCRSVGEYANISKLANQVFNAQGIRATTIQIELDDTSANNNEWSHHCLTTEVANNHNASSLPP